jgi:hypothetical protein
MTTVAYRISGMALLIGCAATLVLAPMSNAEPQDGPAGRPGYNGAPTVVSGGPAPTLNGVPCVGGHLGVCTGFAQNSRARKAPRASVGHSPTISP